MDAAAWLAELSRRGVAQQQAERDRIMARLHPEAESDSRSTVPSRPVLLQTAHIIDADSDQAPAAAQRAARTALAHGWQAVLVRSVAAEPHAGLVEVVTLRLRRHDERAFAAWRNGSFDCAWLGLERLGAANMPAAVRTEPLVGELVAVARAHGIKIPAKSKKADLIALLGPLVSEAQPVIIRGLVDAIEGRRLAV